MCCNVAASPQCSDDRVLITSPATDIQVNDAGLLPIPVSTKWLPEKIICGKVVGLSVSNYDEGWESLVTFAKLREKQNRESGALEKSKRKGYRELQSLVSGINYEKSRGNLEKG